MGSIIEKDIFNFENNYVQVVFSKKRAPLDYELNELQQIQSSYLKAFARSITQDNAVGDGFKVESTGSPNEINIRSGYIYVDGQLLFLPSDLVINTLTTPVSNRTDYVYIEYYPREVDSVEVPALIDAVNINSETAVRSKMQFNTYVAEGTSIPVPALGRKQYLIAVMDRLASVATLSANQIDDRREMSGKNYVSFGSKVTHTGVFSYTFEGGAGLVGGSYYNVGAAVGSVGPNEIRYIYISQLETLVNAASLPTSYHVPLAKIESDNIDIISVTDLRRHTPLSSGGAGSTSTIELTLINNVDAYELGRVSGVSTADKASAASVGTMPALGLFLDDGLVGESVRLLLSGIVSNAAWSFTAGSELFVDPVTPGGIVDVAPVGVGQVKQKIGIAITPTQIFFNPDLTYEVVGGIGLHAQNTDLGTNNSGFIARYGVGAAMVSPSGFYINPGGGDPVVGVRYTGTQMEFSNDGILWQKIGAGGTHWRSDTTGDGVMTVYTLAEEYVPGTSDLLVFVGSVLQNPVSDYVESSSTTVTFVTAPLNGVPVTFLKGLGGGDTVIVSSHQPKNENFTGDGSTVAFVLSQVPISDSMQVFVNSILYLNTVHYTLSGSTITFNAAPLNAEGISVFFDYYA